MGFTAAARKLHRVLQVQHFVVKHVGNNIFRDGLAVQLAIQHNLIQRGIETAQQRKPSSFAPAKARQWQRILKVLLVQASEQRREIVVCAGGSVVRGTRSMLPQAMQPLARASRIRKLPINFEQVLRRSTAVQTPKQNRSSRLEDGRRSIMQRVGEPYISSIFPQTHGESKSGIRMKFDEKIRRGAPASPQGEEEVGKQPPPRGRRGF